MFDEEQLNQFVNKMIENASKTTNKTHAREGLRDFKKYLSETHMCTPEYLKKLEKIIECCDELVALKGKVSSLDVTTLFNEEATVKQPQANKGYQKTLGTKPAPKKQVSSTCGGSAPSYSSRCSSEPSYSSSCGGGSSYSNRC